MQPEDTTNARPTAGTRPERLLQAIWDHSVDAILLTAPDGRIFAANSAACALFGRTEAEICRVGRSGLLDATDPRLAEALAERERTGHTRRELTFLRADGSRFAGELTSAVFADDDGQPRTSMIIRDITERRRAAETIRDQALFPQLNPGPVLRVDARGMISMANPAASAAGLAVGTFFQAHFPATRDLGLPGYPGNGKKCVFEAELGTKFFQFTILGGLPEGQALIYGTEITARRQIETALRESEEQYHNLFEYMFSGFALMEVLFDAAGRPVDHRLLQANAEFDRMTGLKRSEEIGRTSATLGFKWPAEVSQEFYQVALGGPPLQGERFNESLQRYYDRRVFSPRRGQFAMLFSDITERKQAEAALQASEERYRTLFEKIDEGFCVIEMLYAPDGRAVDYRFVELNPAFEKHTGLQHALGKTIRELVPELDAHWFEIYGKVARTGEALRFQSRAAAMQRDYDAFAFRIGGDGSRSVGILFTDITERKRVEDALRESERRFGTIFRASPSAIGISRLSDGIFLDVNDAFVQLYGYPRTEVIGHSSAELRLWQSSNRATVMQAVVATQTCQVVELQGRCKDGTIRDMLAAIETIELAGEPCIVGILTDITDRKQAEAALRQSEQKFRAIFDLAPVGISLMNAERRLTDLNPALEKIMQLTRADLLAGVQYRRRLIHSDGTPMQREDWPSERVIRGQRAVQQVELGTVTEEGRTIWMLVSAAALDPAAGSAVVITQDITARKETEAALRENEQRLRVGLAPANIAVFNQDLDLRYTWIYQQQLGYTVGQVVGNTDFDLMPRAAAEETTAAKRAALQQNGIVRREIQVELPDETRYYDLIVEPLHDVAGHVTGITGASLDITERRQATLQLRASEAAAQARADELATILDATPAITFIAHDRDCRHMTSSRAALRLFRLPDGANTSLSAPPEERATNFRVLQDGRELRPEDLPVQRAAATGQPVQGFELTVPFNDGTTRELIGDAAPLFDAEGQVRGAVGAFLDITEHQQTTAALRRSEERLQRVMEATHDGIWDWDLRTGLAYLNQRCCELTGYQPGEVVPDLAFYTRIVHPDDFPEVRKSVEAQMQGQTDQSTYECRLVTKSGAIRWVLSRGRVVERDAAGAPLRMVGTLTDITERKQAEIGLAASQTALRALAARLQDAREEERQRIAQRVHDELGHAFTDLKLDLAWLDRRLAERELTRRTAVRRKIAEMIRRVEADLHTARTLSAELRPAVLDTLGLVAALEWAAQQFENRTLVRCTLDLPAESPPLGAERAAALFRAFQEILTNVARHAGATAVRIRLTAAAGQVTLTVVDNGRGITAQERDDPRALGLLGLRERARAFGGTVEITGVHGAGTSVLISLPSGVP